MKVCKVAAIIQLSLMYLSLIFLFAGAFTMIGVLALIGFIMAILSSLFALATCVISFFSMFKSKTQDYTKFVMMYKLISIPWFIGNFIFCILLIAGMLNPFLLIAIPIVIIVMILSTYICMLSSSMINFSYLIVSWRNKTIKPSGLVAIGVIFGFIFCLDALGAILIFLENKRHLKGTSN